MTDIAGLIERLDKLGGLVARDASIALAAQAARIAELEEEKASMQIAENHHHEEYVALNERAEKAEAERDHAVAELHIALAAVGHNQGVAKRIEAATVERCASIVDGHARNLWTRQDIAKAIRALKPATSPQVK